MIQKKNLLSQNLLLLKNTSQSYSQTCYRREHEEKVFLLTTLNFEPKMRLTLLYISEFWLELIRAVLFS